MLEKIKKHKAGLLFFGFVFLIIFILGYLFPITGDDWMYRGMMSMDSWLRMMRDSYYSHHVRFLSDFFLQLIGFRVLSALLFSFFITTLLYCLTRFLHIHSLPLRLAAFCLLLAVPCNIFREAYAWRTGFFNYVPPVVCAFAALCIFKRLFDEKSLSSGYKVWQLILIFLLGFASEFFVEHTAFFILCLSIFFVVLAFIRQKETLGGAITYLFGVSIGFYIVATAPAYRNSGYYTMDNSGDGMLNTVISHYTDTINFSVEFNFVICFLTSILCILLLCKGLRLASRKQKILRICLLVDLALTPIYFVIHSFYADHRNGLIEDFYFNNNPPSDLTLAIVLDMIIVLLYFVCVLLCCIFYIAGRKQKRLTLFTLIAIPVAIAPMIVLSPIAPRCFYCSYVFFIALVLLLMQTVCSIYNFSPAQLKLPMIIITACVCAYYLVVAGANCNMWKYQEATITDQMSIKEKTIYLPQYPFPEYEQDVAYLEVNGVCIPQKCYFYEIPYDLDFAYLPFDEWQARMQQLGLPTSP